MMRPSSSKITFEEVAWISPGVEDGTQQVKERAPYFLGLGGSERERERASYFSGLFSASVTDGDAPDTQDLVGLGENWKE
jgi:hypothetical protein